MGTDEVLEPKRTLNAITISALYQLELQEAPYGHMKMKILMKIELKRIITSFSCAL